LKRSNRLILLIGVFLAALAFVIVIVLLSGGGSNPGDNGGPTAPPSKLSTVIATRDVALGVTITTDMLTTQELDVNARETGAFSERSQVIGKVARTNITKGQQVTTADFAESSGANLEVPPGFTGIAVQVDQLSGVGTLIKTGDYVDVIAQISPGNFPLNFFADPNAKTVTNEGPLYDPSSVKVLIQGVQVITTILPPPPTTETGVAATPGPDSGGTSLNGQQEIVIIAVTEQQAEVIKFAQVDGNITLTLRSPKDFVDDSNNPIVPETVVTSGITLKTLVDKWGVLPPLWVIVAGPTQ
jgi:pilus assembly protein CpaB